EQTDNDANWRHLVDAVAIVKPIDKLTLGINGDLGHETAVPMVGDATWDGLALYARVDATERFALPARGEWFTDLEGARTGTAQTLVEGTLTPTVKVSDNFILRGDLRVDRSDHTVFATSDAMSHHQVTIAINAIGVL